MVLNSLFAASYDKYQRINPHRYCFLDHVLNNRWVINWNSLGIAFDAGSIVAPSPAAGIKAVLLGPNANFFQTTLNISLKARAQRNTSRRPTANLVSLEVKDLINNLS
jgi:hypothetical protein